MSLTPPELSFPRQNARTQRFTLGQPRGFVVSPDGSRVVFIRSLAGDDRVGRLWLLDPRSGAERLLADPVTLLGSADEQLSAQERSRRERMREAGAGVVAFSVDREVRHACFTLLGRLFVSTLDDATTVELPAAGPVVDPRLDPTGRHVAYASGNDLRVSSVDGAGDRLLLAADGDHVVVGRADFIAAEELDRSRGFWWSPDGDRLLVERYDEQPVQVWHVSDPANPERSAVEQRYPAAGTPNARVRLLVAGLDGSTTDVVWDETAVEYLAAVHWSRRGRPLAQVLDRRQGRAQVLAVDPESGVTSVLREQVDDAWVDVMPGVPAWGPDGRLLTVEPAGDRYALCADGEPVTPSDLQVHAVLDVGDDDVLLSGSTHPAEDHVYRWSAGGTQRLTTLAGVHAARRGGPTRVTVTASLESPLPVSTVTTPSGASVVTSYAETPGAAPNVQLLPGGPADLRIAVVLPGDWHPGSQSLPVLMDPYGGPHAQQVRATQGRYREAQWFADQGFAVVIVDGRGTPGSPSWERAIRHRVADVALADQVTGLHAAAHAFPDLDLTRVAIRGWSFGGFLAALAVLRRPDVFHVAVAGAPVTDWRRYDTGYTERYLGLPDENPAAYDRCSLLLDAPALTRPLMLIHGFADDNVFVAHTLQLSAALTTAGRPHTLLPLSGITHLASQEDVAENLLLLQVDFLLRSLPPAGVGGAG